MPNKNYFNGRSKEYRTMEKLRKLGCDIVLRSAGSHSPIDVIGIDIKRNHIRFIQCKPRSMSDNKKKEILQQNIGLTDANWVTTFEVV